MTWIISSHKSFKKSDVMELAHKPNDLPILFWSDNTPITLAIAFLVLNQSSYLAHSSLWARGWALKYFFDFVEKEKLDFELMRYGVLEHYRDFLLGGDDPKSIQTAKAYITHVVEFLKWAKDRGEFRVLTFPNQPGRLWRGRQIKNAGVRMPRPGRKDIKVIAPDDVKTLIERVGDPNNYKREAQFQAERNRLLYRTLFMTGLRREEVLKLDDSIFGSQQQGNGYSVEILGKGNVLRKTIYPASLMDGLTDFYSTTRHEHLLSLHRKSMLEKPCRNIFISTRGKMLTESSINDLFNTWSERTGIHHTPHMCRHTFATGFYLANRTKSNDMDVLMLLKSLLGHKSIQTTIDTYLHVAEAEAGLSYTENYFKLFEGDDE